MDPTYPLQVLIAVTAWSSLGLGARILIAQLDARRRQDVDRAR